MALKSACCPSQVLPTLTFRTPSDMSSPLATRVAKLRPTRLRHATHALAHAKRSVDEVWATMASNLFQTLQNHSESAQNHPKPSETLGRPA